MVCKTKKSLQFSPEANERVGSGDETTIGNKRLINIACLRRVLSRREHAPD